MAQALVKKDLVSGSSLTEPDDVKRIQGVKKVFAGKTIAFDIHVIVLPVKTFLTLCTSRLLQGKNLNRMIVNAVLGVRIVM